MTIRTLSLVSAATLSFFAGGAHAQLAQAPNLGSLLQPEVVTTPPVIQAPTAGNISTRVDFAGTIRQEATQANDRQSTQRADVGSVRRLQGTATVTTNASLLGTINQTQQRSPTQRIGIASVDDVAGGGQIQTGAVVSGDVSQDAGGPSVQDLRVGAVVGGAPSSATTSVVAPGDIRQSTGNANGGQNLSIGSVEFSTGRASTNVVVGAILNQEAAGAGGVKQQSATIGSVTSASGDIETRVSAQGVVNQFLSSQNDGEQRIHVGSVRGVVGQRVRTDVTMNGTLSQIGAGSRADQTILLGAVVAE